MKLLNYRNVFKNVKDWMTNNFLLLNSDRYITYWTKNSTQNLLDHNLQLDG